MSVTHRRTNELMDWMEHIMIAIFIVLDRSSTFIVLDRGSTYLYNVYYTLDPISLLASSQFC